MKRKTWTGVLFLKCILHLYFTIDRRATWTFYPSLAYFYVHPTLDAVQSTTKVHFSRCKSRELKNSGQNLKASRPLPVPNIFTEPLNFWNLIQFHVQTSCMELKLKFFGSVWIKIFELHSSLNMWPLRRTKRHPSLSKNDSLIAGGWWPVVWQDCNLRAILFFGAIFTDSCIFYHDSIRYSCENVIDNTAIWDPGILNHALFVEIRPILSPIIEHCIDNW